MVTLVQSRTNLWGNGITVGFSSAPTPGNLLVVIGMHDSSDAGFGFISGGEGWSTPTVLSRSTNRHVGITWKIAGSSEANAAVFHGGDPLNTTITHYALYEFAFEGTGTVSLVDMDSAYSDSNTTSISCGSVTTTEAEAVLVAGMVTKRVDSGTVSFSNSFTAGSTGQQSNHGSSHSSAAGHRLVSSTGTYSTTASWTGTRPGTALGALFAFQLVPGSGSDGPFTLDVDVVGEGTVDIDPDLEEYEADTEITLTATAEEGNEFVGWSGDITSTDNPLVFEITDDTQLTATFLPESVEVQIVDVAVVGDASTPSTLNLSTLTISGTNRYLLTAVAYNNDNLETVSSVVLDPTGLNVPLTHIATGVSEDDGLVALYGLVNPPTGTYTIRATLSAALIDSGQHAAFLGAWALAGIDQDEPIRSSDGNGGQDVSSIQVTLSTQVGDLVLGAAFCEGAANDNLDFVSVSPAEDDWDTSAGWDSSIGSHRVALGTSTQMRWTIDAVEHLASAVVALRPAIQDPDPDEGNIKFWLVQDSQLPPSGPVQVNAETQEFASGTGDIADDPAIWVDYDNPGNSAILGSKKASSGGGVAVYDLSGAQIQFHTLGEINNVDLRQNVFDGRVLVVGTNRSNNTLAFMWFDTSSRQLSNCGSVSVGFEPYGCALYVSAVSGKVYAFVTQNAETNGAFDQYELTESAGTVSGTRVRQLTTSSLCEGCVADDVSQSLFLSEEELGLYRYDAEPDGGSSRTTVDTVSGHLTADVEGVTIAYGHSRNYLIVSSQGDSTFQVYDLEPPYTWRKSFTLTANGGVDAVSITDGIAVEWRYMGPLYPEGLFVAHDSENAGASVSNFKLVNAGAILGNRYELLELDVDGLWDGENIIEIDPPDVT